MKPGYSGQHRTALHAPSRDRTRVRRSSHDDPMLQFMTFSILVFNFYPGTAVTIALLSLLNDDASTLSIAHDRGRSPDQPSAQC